MEPTVESRDGSITSPEDESLPGVHVTKFKTPEIVGLQIDQTLGDVLYVEDVSEQDFTAVERYRESKRRKYRFKRVYPAHHLLIITIPTNYHESPHLNLYYNVRRQIDDMGIADFWVSGGAQTYKAGGMAGSGEGDSTGKPTWPGITTPREWPTLVIEAGYTQSLQALRQDMRWWFSASGHQVKIVLLVKVHPSPSATALERMAIEKYQERSSLGRPGATTTRSASRHSSLELRCTQEISVKKTSENAVESLSLSYNVTRGALRLEFSDLFLRQPRPEQGEHDIIIGIEELKRVAAAIVQ